MKKLFTISSFAILSLFAFQLHAQLVPRTILVEEGTNWSCPPCATYNPGIETFLNQHEGGVIHLAYHPNWPGADDPMYLNDKNDNQSRVVNYYGISGVPDVKMDGVEADLTSAQALESTLAGRIGVGSPVAITVSRELNGTADTVFVHVTIHPVADLSSYKQLALRVAAAEEMVKGPGPNGEKQYIHPMRAMMPDYNGTKVKLSTHDTSFSFKYPLKSTYNAANMYEVAFLQDDASKEVLQAATDEQGFSLALNTGAKRVQRVGTDPVSVGFNLNNGFTSTRTFNVSYTPTSAHAWPVTITTGNGAANGPVELTAGSSLPVSLSVTAGDGTYSSGVLKVTSTSGSQTLVSSYPVKFIAPDVKIAYIDLSVDSVRSANTVATLDALQFRWVPLSGGEATSMNGWTVAEFPEMVVGGDKGILTGSDKQGVGDYLANGGHLFIQGGEIGFGLADPATTASDKDVSFLNNVLKAGYVKDSAGPHVVHGVSNDLVSGDFASESLNIYANNVDAPNQPDEIKAMNGSIPIFYYGTGTSQVSGIRWETGATRCVYLSFGLQNLNDQDRSAITTDVFKWFRSAPASGVGTASTPDGLSLEPNYPNPFTSTTQIQYSIGREEPVRIGVVDTRGVEVATVVNEVQSAGTHSASFDVHGLPRGTYFYVLHTQEGSLMRAMTIK